MAGHDVGSEIRGMISNLERDNPNLSATARIKRAWNNIADQRTREHVTAVFVVPDTDASEVIIYVDNSIWATELNMQVEILRLNLNMQLSKDDVSQGGIRKAEQVESLKFVVSKQNYVAKSRRMTTFEQLEEEEKAYRSIEPIPLSQDEISGLQEAASMVENDELRERAYAAAKANLEWQKGLEKLGA